MELAQLLLYNYCNYYCHLQIIKWWPRETRELIQGNSDRKVTKTELQMYLNLIKFQ